MMKADEVPTEEAQSVGGQNLSSWNSSIPSLTRQFFKYLTAAIMSKYRICLSLKFLAATLHDYFILSFG